MLVDHGLMRLNEADQVVAAMEELGVKLIRADVEQRFLDKLAGVDDPERKRKIIGEEFIRVFEDEAAKLEGVGYLVQGTLYSDVIESGGDGRTADTIKSHHNVGGLPEDLGFDLVEPLRMLFKDEVRAVAPSSASPSASSGASRSRAPASRSGSSVARSTASGSTSSATRTRSSRRRSRRRASIASSGNPSACSRSCARSASRATGAPTPTRS